MIGRFAVLLAALSAAGGAAAQAPASPPPTGAAPDSVTVPLLVEGNRPFIDVSFRRRDGSVRSARFLIDTGGGGFLMTESLARDLGVTWGESMKEEGTEFAPAAEPPSAWVGSLALALEAERVFVVLGKSSILPKAAPGHAEGMFPGHVLAKYHVVFDYPNATFTLARPGMLTPQGEASPMPVSQRQRFPRTELQLDGTTYGFLLDTGASFTIVSEALLKELGGRHPEWPRHEGAFGDAATLGGQTLETLIVPRAQWAGFEVVDLGITSQREGAFERWMSSMMTAPIIGALAGNVLKHFRVELDYAGEKLYLSRPAGGATAEAAFAELQRRGREAMGVDQYTSTHRFDALPDGGRIELQRDSADAAGIATIRQHLREIVSAFRAGDFRIPGFVHAQEVPGTAVMARKKDVITYTFAELPRGGQIRITTGDPSAVAAIHEFMAFQRHDHRAGGHH